AVDSPSINVSTRDIDYATSSDESKNLLALTIEDRFGIPHLPPVSVENMGGRSVKPSGVIKQRLDKYKKRAWSEIKELKKIGADINEAQNPRTLGAIEALTW